MIIIPRLKTVVILTPRTGSGTLRRVIAEHHPDSFMLYRHMEASGVPMGYDRWLRVGVFRNPFDRMWSLYKFLKVYDGSHSQAYITAMRESVQLPFNEWLTTNKTIFVSSHNESGGMEFFPEFTVQYSMPETRKSQFYYLRPDLGTKVFHFRRMHQLYRQLELPPPEKVERYNQTTTELKPHWTADAIMHMNRFFHWDICYEGTWS